MKRYGYNAAHKDVQTLSSGEPGTQRLVAEYMEAQAGDGAAAQRLG